MPSINRATKSSPSRSITVSIYHDESGTDQSQLLLHGALFVPDGYRKEAVQALLDVRGSFINEIHFNELRDSDHGHHAERARVANGWLQVFVLKLSEHLRFKCMVVDKESFYYQELKRRNSSHPYNHSAMLTIWGGIALFYRDYDYVSFSIFSDERSVGYDDNFTDYVPREVALRARRKRANGGECPNAATVRPHVVMLDSDPTKVMAVHRHDCEFIQLTDLLTSAIAQAINADAQREIKKVVARTVAEWVQDTNLPPWLQEMSLHHCFSAQHLSDDGFSSFEPAILQPEQDTATKRRNK